MTPPRGALPTLTEVIEITPCEGAPTVSVPLAPDSEPLEPLPSMPTRRSEPALPRLGPFGPDEVARIVDAVVEQLQPRIEGWVREQLSAAVTEAVRASVETAADDVARRLRSELPTLVRTALEEVRPDGFDT